jgi:CheY-like chemotaxis protein
MSNLFTNPGESRPTKFNLVPEMTQTGNSLFPSRLPDRQTASGDIAALCPDEHGINNLNNVTCPPSLSFDDGSRLGPAEVVCLVDDDPSIRQSIACLLESAGFRVSAFSDPETFLEYATVNSVPLVVLDIWMEKMTGIELLVHLRVRSPGTRVILISGYVDPAVESIVKQDDALAFLTKSFQDDEFLNAVRRALGHSVLEEKAIA